MADGRPPDGKKRSKTSKKKRSKAPSSAGSKESSPGASVRRKKPSGDTTKPSSRSAPAPGRPSVRKAVTPQSKTLGGRALIVGACFVIIVAGMKASREILVPFLFSLFIAVLAGPPISAMKKRGLPTWLAMLTVLGALSLAGLFVTTVVTRSISSFKDNLPTYEARLEAAQKKVLEWEPPTEILSFFGFEGEPNGEPNAETAGSSPDVGVAAGVAAPDDVAADEDDDVAAAVDEEVPQVADDPAPDAEDLGDVEALAEAVEDAVNDALKEAAATGETKSVTLSDIDLGRIKKTVLEFFDLGSILTQSVTYLSEAASLATNALLILLTVVFMLLEVSTMPRKILAISGRNGRELLERIMSIADDVNHYMLLKTLVSVLTGVLVAIWLTWLDVDFPLLWGLLAFLLNFVPNLGSILAAVPAVLLAWIQLGASTAGLVLAGFVAVNMLVGNVIEPRLLGRGLGLSTLVVFLSLVFWGWVLGPLGMVLSVPLTMACKVALQSSGDMRWVAILLSGEPTKEQLSIKAAKSSSTSAPPTTT